MISNALSLLFGIIIIAAVVPFVFSQFGGLEEAVEGRCVARHAPAGVTAPRPYPADLTTWSVGQDWQAGGPFHTGSVPSGTCTESMTQTEPDDGSNSYGITYNYAPTDLTGNNFTGIITALLDLMPIAIFVGVFGLVGTFAWRKFGGRGSSVPGM